MAWYSTGTIAVTNGSKVALGTGTGWFGALQAGWGLVGPDGRPYEIEVVSDATSITLKTPYLGSTAGGQSYAAFPTMSLANDLVARLNTLIGGFQSVKDEAGAGKFGDGTAAAPGVAFLADQDTGLYRPAANELGFSAGGVKRALLSTTAMTFDVKVHAAAGVQVTGSVGIGTAAPSARLHVQSPDEDHLRLAFSAASFTDIYRPNTGGLSIAPQGTERVRIDADGNVGVGVAIPSERLEVEGRVGASKGVFSKIIAPVTEAPDSLLNGGAPNAARMLIVAGGYADSKSGTYMRLDGGVTGSNLSKSWITATYTGDYSSALKLYSGKLGNIAASDNDSALNVSMQQDLIQFYTGSRGLSDTQEKMRIDGLGRVGIGTNAPSQLLDVSNPTGSAYAAISNPTGDNRLVLGATTSAGPALYAQTMTGGAEHMRLFNGPLQTMHLASDGKVGVGTSNPQQKFHVNYGSSLFTSGANGIGVMLAGTSTGTENVSVAGFYENNGETRQGFIGFGSSGTKDLYILNQLAGGGVILDSGAGGDMKFRIGGTDRMRLDPNGTLLVGKSTATFSTPGSPAYVGYLSSTRDSSAVMALNRIGSAGTLATLHHADTQVGQIVVSASSTTYATSSDYRLKTAGAAPTDFDACAKVAELAAAQRWYSWQAEPEKLDLGWFAHELQEIHPDAVTGEKDEVDEDGEMVMQGRDDSKLIPILTAALAEALAEIKNLKARISALEAN